MSGMRIEALVWADACASESSCSPLLVKSADRVAIRDSIPMVAEGCRDSLPPMVRHGSGGTYGIVDKYFKDRFVAMQIY